MNKRFLHIVVVLVFSLLFQKAGATHLVGGFISYEYVGASASGVRYNVTITSYRDCKPGSIPFATDIDVCIYKRNDLRLQATHNFQRISIEKVNPVGRTDCPEATQVCLEKAIFRKQVTLPVSSFGYIIKWEICCRNQQVNLRDNADGEPFIGQTYQTIIPDTRIRNSTPFFTDVPVPFICINDTSQINNYAVDPDGDSLVYRMAVPWYGASLTNNYPGCSPIYEEPVSISPSDYKTGYNGNMPFGANGISTINSRNGVTTFLARQVGNYAVAIDLLEFRDGQLLSTTRLDMQILVINCTPNNKPSIAASGANFTVMAGDRLCFDVTAKDKDNHNITLTGVGDILTGANGFKGSRATFASAFGKGSVSSQFCWQTSCSQASSSPYIFTAKAIDDGCPSKFTLVNFNITVLPFTGRVTINGPLSVCEGSKGSVYTLNTTANTPAELTGLTHLVSVSGGTLVSQTANQIVVNWNRGISTGSINVIPMSRFGCPGTPTVINITLQPSPPKPVLVPFDTLCENTSKTYSIQSTPAYTYLWWTDNGGINGSNTSNSVSVTWGSPGNARLYLLQYSQNGCPSDTSIMDVWISKPQTPDIVGKQSICPNSSGLVYSVSETSAGSSFLWFINGGSISGSNSGSSVTVNWGNPGTGYIKVVEINRFGCPGDTVQMAVLKTYALSGETIQGDTDICAFSTLVAYKVLNTPNTIYNWTVVGGNIVSGQGSSEIYVNWGSSGTGSVSVFETSFDSVNMRQCISNLIVRTVNIRPYPIANALSGLFEVCQSSTSGSIVLNGYLTSGYLWSINGDTSGISGQGSNTIQIPYSTAGTFNIRVTETTEYGCAGNPVDTVLTIHPRPQTEPIQGSSTICHPNLSNYSYSVKGMAGSQFIWIVEGGTILNPDGGDNITVNWSGQQNNRVRVIELSDFGCPGDTLSLDVFYDRPSLYLNYITVNPPPGSDNIMESYWRLINAPRYNSQLFIEKRPAGSGASFVAAGTINGTSLQFSDINTNNDSNAWEYRIRGFDLCGQPIYSDIHTNILLKGSKTGGYEITMNFTPYLGWGNAGIRYDLYRLLKNAGQYELYEPNISGFKLDYSNGLEYYTQCYRIKGTKAGSDTATWSNEVCFNFEPVIFIPNAFSPNSDDYNDFFRVKGGALKTVEFYIFNRWGEKLFEGKSIDDAWDGTYKGKDQPQDVYMYYCYYTGFDGRRYSTKGTVSLLR